MVNWKTLRKSKLKHIEKRIENKEISRNVELSEKANKSVLKSQKEKTDKM